MKKTVLLISALLSCCLAYSQEASVESGNHGELTIIPRVDFDAYVPFQNPREYASVDFGTTSLYTLFEGDFADHFSFSVCNHWLSTTPGDLYRNTFHSDECNWLDWATITGQFGNFFFTAGKDIIALATNENEANDYDSHYQMNTYLWNALQTYQWGGRVGWISSDESSQAGFQFTTSPAGEMFYSGKFTYTAFGSHDFENANLSASASFIRNYWEEGTFGDRYTRLYAISGKYRFADFTPGLDVFYMSTRHFGCSLTCEADFNDHLGILGKVSYERIANMNRFNDALAAGASLYWYPLKGSRDLRIHGMAAYGNYSDGSYDPGVSFSIGATYFFNITVF